MVVVLEDPKAILSRHWTSGEHNGFKEQGYWAAAFFAELQRVHEERAKDQWSFLTLPTDHTVASFCFASAISAALQELSREKEIFYPAFPRTRIERRLLSQNGWDHLWFALVRYARQIPENLVGLMICELQPMPADFHGELRLMSKLEMDWARNSRVWLETPDQLRSRISPVQLERGRLFLGNGLVPVEMRGILAPLARHALVVLDKLPSKLS